MADRQKINHRFADLSRSQGVREIKQSFLIVCEGEKTEPDYFKSFRMTAATIRAVGQAMNTMTLVNRAICIREADKKRKKTYDQCWVVFDKDDFPSKDFNQAIKLAEKNGFNVAYSNQAFEYWFLRKSLTATLRRKSLQQPYINWSRSLTNTCSDIHSVPR